MSKKNETSVQIIENASSDDIQAGDYVIWSEASEYRGLTLTDLREGVAHHRNEFDEWCVEGGMWITGSEWAGSSITIRRPITEEG